MLNRRPGVKHESSRPGLVPCIADPRLRDGGPAARVRAPEETQA